jgi:Family of unknown function (DUF6236)
MARVQRTGRLGMTGMSQPEPVRLGLYYPFIQFRSDSWLKLAALYWDRIGRIVPPGYVLQDSDTVRRLEGELGFVTNLAPSGAEMDSVSSEFLELLAERGPELSDLYGMQGRELSGLEPAGQSWPSPWTNVAPPLGGPQWQVPVDPSLLPGADPRLAYIYASGKMTPQMESALIDTGLGVPVRAHGLIGMHPQFAFVYMHALASKMATSVMCPLTDDDFDHVASGCAAGRIAGALLDFPAGQMAPDGEGEGPALEFAMLALQSVIPKDISSLPVQKIIEIRRRHPEELTAFQQATQTIMDSVPEAAVSASAEVGAMYLQALYEKTLEPELRRLKASLRKSGIDSVFGAMSVKVQSPELVTSGAAIFGIGALHLNPVMMGTGAVVMCLIPRIRRQQAEAQRLRAESPAAYLLRLEEELRPASLASDIAAKAKRLIGA